MNTQTKTDRHQQTPYPLRLPNELREALTEKAGKNQRSLHGEIIFRLKAACHQQTQGAAQ
jgi:hypothetical protein